MNFDALVERSDGFSGADVQAVCRLTALEVIREAIARGETAAAEPPLLIRQAHLEHALSEVRGQKQMEH